MGSIARGAAYIAKVLILQKPVGQGARASTTRMHAGRLLVVCSAKKRKPAESDNNKASEAEFVEVSKRRITGAAVGGMSVRQQLYAVRAVKKMTAGTAKSYQKTKYRKEKPKEGTEEANAAKMERARKKQPLNALSLYGPDGEFNPPVLIVDGYNVIGYWAKLKKHFDAGHLDVARERLLSELGEYLHAKGLRVICVFDAAGGAAASTRHETMPYDVEVVYEAVHTADTYIERRCRELLDEKSAPVVIVATNDVQTLRCVIGQGAQTCTSKLLIQEMKKMKEDCEELLQVSGKKKFYGAHLSEDVRMKLLALRNGGPIDEGIRIDEGVVDNI
mmetsp:Transcript_13353/g.22541  ORF Transcript_13353/g.22541 Transcript_13353/m.22541 type:complete len:332 (-) Transcript_13353:158-1153(-)|eukprot:CAMPEP_0198199988 /NCGR_PEP_ID=MMETSP1445-20131203/3069_1 /TAXON_ID=36898 /ORGANISM="Pyramimonas sp., Strain CCMP2087" /LENGTH=331 /DNA_ID=CAMNT_0043869907 /DNA_START=332 /DNA_END=1327 /DNA_ORIENTATION=+